LKSHTTFPQPDFLAVELKEWDIAAMKIEFEIPDEYLDYVNECREELGRNPLTKEEMRQGLAEWCHGNVMNSPVYIAEDL